MVRYLVGEGTDRPSLTEAINAASDGDTIELESGYCPTVDKVNVNKSLNFIGHVTKKEEGGKTFQNVINGQFFIRKGATVSFQDLWICLEKPKCNIINCKEKSILQMTNVVIENMQTEEDDYPVIYAEEKSELKFEDVSVRENEKWPLRSYFQDCNVKIDNSRFWNCKLVIENSDFTVNNSSIYGTCSNALECKRSKIKFDTVTIACDEKEKNRLSLKCNFDSCNVEINNSSFGDAITARNTQFVMNNSDVFANKSNAFIAYTSTVTLNAVTVFGYQKEKRWPAIWCENSRLMTNQCTVEQDEFEGAVYLNKNSYLESSHDKFESLWLTDSRGICTASTIRGTFQVVNQSYVCIKEEINILGSNEKKIDLFVYNNSVVIGDKISVNRVFDPNFRIGASSFVAFQEVEYVQGFVSELFFEIDGTSKLFYQNEVRNAEKINENAEQLSEEKTMKNEKPNSAREQLNRMIGLTSVKKEIDKMLHLAEFNRQRIAKGLQPQEQSFHSVFLGNPGTGKTTVARLIGEVLYESGAFKSDEFKLIEASEPDFISENVGGTAQQTLALLEQAKGGVLFIDEAYALNKKGSSVDFGIEAINTIIKYMEDHRGEIMIIFAGYTKEMEQFLKTNPGLASRVPNKFVFEDYTPDEIVEIGERDLEKKMYTFEDREYYAQQVKRAYHASLDHSNARWIRNFNEKLLKVFAERVMNNGEEDLETIKKVDLDAALAQGKYQKAENEDDREQAFDRLQKMVGIEKVKEQVNRFISLAELNQRREEQGQMNQDFTLHSLFLGNPGTGKTTVARIIGEVLYQKGIIAEKKFIEASRSDLVAGYVGQTALKTREVLESALGGVLFIDEAYSLNSDSQNDFGLEAINEILKFMEDHRKDMVIIFAGYTKEMNEFLKQNSGLASRIPHTFDFEDYTPEEIVQIGLMGIHNAGYVVDESYYSEVVKNNYAQSKEHSNGRWVRNLNEQLIMVMSDRVAKSEDADINTILKEDLDVIAIHHQIIG